VTVLLLPPLPPGIVSGTPIRASVCVRPSPEVMSHHLAVHACPGASYSVRDGADCEGCGGRVEVWRCDVCDQPLAVDAVEMCEHIPALLEDIASGVFAL
jgi:RecJ-like exonuclease